MGNDPHTWLPDESGVNFLVPRRNQSSFGVFLDRSFADHELDNPHQVCGERTSRMSIASLEYGSDNLGVIDAIRVLPNDVQHQDLQAICLVVFHGVSP